VRPTAQDEPRPAGGIASERLARALLLPMLFAAVFFVYRPAWHGELIWDDDTHLTRTELRTWAGLARIWAEPGATQQYYPVVHSAFWIEHKLFGDAPTGYHFVNLALHAANAWLVALLVWRLAAGAARSRNDAPEASGRLAPLAAGCIAAGIFALHPVMVESVAWISELKNVLSTQFYLLATLAWLRFDEGRRTRWWWMSAGLFCLALGSKTVTATLPGALLVLAWWRRGALSWRRDVAPVIPFFAIGAAAGLFTAWFERALIGARGTEFTLPWLDRCLIAGRVAWFYAGKLLWPADLAFIYPRWSIDARDPVQYLWPVASASVLAALWLLRRRWRGPLAGALFFGGTLLPVLGFFNVYPFLFSFVADHFQYVASLGVIVPAAIAASRPLALPRWRAAALGTMAVLGVVLGVLTWRQSRMYADPLLLYRGTTRANPTCWMAWINLGGVHLYDRNLDEAIACYEEGLRLRPDLAKAHFDLGTALAFKDRMDEAIAEFREAVKLKPDYVKAHHNLGSALGKAERFAEAEREFRAVVRLQPDFAEAHRNLALVLDRMGRRDEALREFDAAVRLRPGDERMRRQRDVFRESLGLQPAR